MGQTSWPVGIVVGPAADDLERYAADQLCDYLHKLYRWKVHPTTELAQSADVGLLVGSPSGNPTIRKALGPDGWPKVSDQGIVLRRSQLNGKPVLVIGGESPRATMWAVYELVERWGVRYLLHGDVLPEKPAEFRLPETDTVLEPTFPIRQWRVVNVHACGPESWGMVQYRPLLDQLAKLKFNRLMLNIWPWHPFLHFSAGGIQRQSANLFLGLRFPITDDMPGRWLFASSDRNFWNPDLPQNASYKEFSAAGEKLIHSLMALGHQRGMECVITANMGEFTPEFAPLLKGAQKVHQIGELTVVPGAGTSVEDPGLTELASAVLRATVNTYPESDYLLIGTQEHRQWYNQYADAWKELDARYGIGKIRELEDLLAAAARRSDYPGGAERAVREVKGDIVALRFYDRLLKDLKVLRGTRRPDIPLIYDGFADELLPILPHLVPAGSETLDFVDYTATRILRKKETLQYLSGDTVPRSLIYTLHDDNVGVLPQLTTGPLHEITKELQRHHCSGFSTRYWLLGDHDPCVAYLARASWDRQTTPEAIYRDQIRAVYGDRCVDDMLSVFREVEAATLGLETYGLDTALAFPVPGMIMKHWTPEPTNPDVITYRQGYERALEAAVRARDKATKATGRSHAQYWIGRLKFGIGYLRAIEQIHEAARAESQQKPAQALQRAQSALIVMVQAIEDYAAVALDRSDLGAIATMGELVYRPLKDKVASLARPGSRGQAF